MEQEDFSELAHNEQFVFVEGHSDKSGSHVFRKVVEGSDIYAFTTARLSPAGTRARV